MMVAISREKRSKPLHLTGDATRLRTDRTKVMT